MSIPVIRPHNGHPMLFVEDQPFYIVGGEVHNSDSSGPAYMEGIWQCADELGLNTLLLPVSWELVEPEEGRFDFTVPDALIQQARRYGKRIVFLWFGAWKNAEMTYAPAWVKTDRKRFRRAQIVKGKDKAGRSVAGGRATLPYYTLSALCEATVTADGKAFAALMAHLKEVDGAQHTVIGVQVENETGLLGSARDRSDAADAAFAAPVPEGLAAFLRAHPDWLDPDLAQAVAAGAEQGSWTEVFGAGAEELFSAYYTARYLDTVALQGKAAYPLPMFANCWLVHKGDKPGDYPSGGPVARVRGVWRFAAPTLDVLGPDIYVPEFLQVCDEYTRDGSPLFIPEAATHAYAAPRLAYCIGHYHAMCYSPFGFDDIGHPFSAIQGYLFGMDVTDPALKTPQDKAEYAWFAHTLTAMMPVLAPLYGTDALQAACAESGEPQATLALGKLNLSAIFRNPMVPDQLCNGVVLAARVAPDTYYLLAYHTMLNLAAGDAENLDILSLEEGQFENGSWKPGRRLNGDEAAMLMIGAPRLLKLRVSTYEDGE